MMIIFQALRNNFRHHWNKWLLIAIIIFGYFQISFFLFPLKFGAIAYHFPWRVAIIESIRAGEFPFWYFTQHLGVPIYADPQSGAWYPIVWFFSLFGKYNLYSFHIEFIFHIIIAGFGMQSLAKVFGISKFSGFLISIAYVFSGIFADNVLTSWTISMAWMPVIMASIIRLADEINWRNTLAVSLSLTMLITGGYPAFTILLAYFILGFVVFKLFQLIIKSRKKAWIYSGANFAVLFLSFLMTAVFLLSVYQSFNFIGRTQPLALNYAADGSLHFKSFVTFLLPFAAVDTENLVIPGLDTYFTMANSYFGLIPLIFVFGALFDFKEKKNYFLFLLGFLILLFSMGTSSFVYSFFFDYLPGFNLFRYPNFVRAFFIPIFLLIAGFSFDKLLNNNKIKQLNYIIFSLIILFLCIIIYFLLLKNWNFNYVSFYVFFKEINLSQRIIIQSFFQIFILISFYFILKRTSGIRLKYGLLAVVLLDLIVSFQINFIYTGYAPRLKLVDAQKIIDQKSSPIKLENNENVFSNSLEPMQYFFDYGLTDYQGKINKFGNVSFKTNGFDSIMNIYPDLFQRVTSNPALYFSSNINAVDQIVNSDSIFSKSDIYLSKLNYEKYRHSIEDQIADYQITESKFSSNSVRLNIKNRNNGFLVLIQNYYPGWNVLVDNIPQEIVVSNFTFLSVFIEKGQHEVVFTYENKSVSMAFYMSAILFVIGLFWFFYLVVIEKFKH